MYEDDTRKLLESLVKRCDRRCEVHDRKRARPPPDPKVISADTAKLLDLEAQLEAFDAQIVPLARQGLVASVFMTQTTCDALCAQRDQLLRVPDAERQLLVCPTTGNLIARADKVMRLKAYFEGRQYIGSRKIRETLATLEEKRKLQLAARAAVMSGTGANPAATQAFGAHRAAAAAATAGTRAGTASKTAVRKITASTTAVRTNTAGQTAHVPATSARTAAGVLIATATAAAT
jgi:hypothetical protein